MEEAPPVEHEALVRLLSEELQTLARLRTVEELRSAELPALFGLPGLEAFRDDPARRSEALRGHVTAALEAIPDAVYRTAATDVWGFEDRWTRPLKERQATAATRFGLVESHDALRKKRKSGLSPYDELARELARALLLLSSNRSSPPAAPQPPESSQPGPSSGPAAPRRFPLRPALAAATAVLLAAAVGVLLARGTGTQPEDEAAAEGGVAILTERLRSTYLYHQAGGDGGDEALRLAGRPVRVDEHDRHVAVVLSDGGLIVGESADEGPQFWVPPQGASRWEDAGGADGSLGLPTSNPHQRAGVLVQDYELGYTTLADDGSVEMALVPDRRAELPDLGALRDKIVRQSEGTAWYVDDEGRRHWIPDGGVWGCRGGWGNVAANDVPGYAVWSLPDGDVAACPGS